MTSPEARVPEEISLDRARVAEALEAAHQEKNKQRFQLAAVTIVGSLIVFGACLAVAELMSGDGNDSTPVVSDDNAQYERQRKGALYAEAYKEFGARLEDLEQTLRLYSNAVTESQKAAAEARRDAEKVIDTDPVEAGKLIALAEREEKIMKAFEGLSVNWSWIDGAKDAGELMQRMTAEDKRIDTIVQQRLKQFGRF